MAENKSIYKLITDNIIDGRLREDFVLPDEEDDDCPVKFAAGARDGMCIYHIQPYQMTEDDYKLLERSIAAVSNGDFEQTDSLWAELGRTARAIQVVDEFQQYIRDHADEIDVATAYPCIFDIVCRSSNKESIKFALTIMELLDTEHDFIKKVVRNIALSDEFTIFAVWIMRGWENGNDELLELAKKVKGWGRIHIVDLIDPDTDEIREWLLTEGTKNDVVYGYSALTCWEKSGAEEKIRGELTYKEYQGVLTLIEALLEEGPVPGISKIDNADQKVSSVLSRWEKYDLTADDYQNISCIRTSIDSDENYPLSARECDTILSSDKCINTVNEAVKQGKAIRLAKDLGLEYKDKLMSSLENDFDSYKSMCDCLMEDERYLERVIDVFRKNIPFEKMTGDPEADVEYEDIYNYSLPYRFFIQNLSDHPLKGTDLVINGLKCKDSACRISALMTIQDWVTSSGTLLTGLSSELYSAVSEMVTAEPNAQAAEMIAELMSGKTEFSE